MKSGIRYKAQAALCILDKMVRIDERQSRAMVRIDDCNGSDRCDEFLKV